MRVSCRSIRQSGQALLETLIVGAMLSIAMGLVLMWAKLQSIDQASAAAARSIAFQCAASRSACSTAERGGAVSQSVLRRLLGDGDREVLSGDRLLSISGVSPTRSFWRRLDGQPLLADLDSSLPNRSSQQFDAGFNVAARAYGAPSGAARLLDRFGPGRFGLDPESGFAVTELELRARAAWPGAASADVASEQTLRFRGRSAMLSDAWNAADVTGDSTGSMAERVRRGSRLDPAAESALTAGYQLSRGALRAASGAGLEPLGRHFKPAQLDVTIVPSDRVAR
jgi:hypothetical protein